MNKKNIQKNDIVEFANGTKANVGLHALWIIEHFYNEDLICSTNREYDIINIYRPVYEKIYERETYEQMSLY